MSPNTRTSGLHASKDHDVRLLQGALSMLALSLACCWSGAAGVKLAPYDLSQDWISDIQAKGVNGCIIAPPSSNRPLPPVPKPGAGNLTVQQIIAQGWRLAPKVYMHPMEWSLLADPAKWLASVPIYDPVDLTMTNLSSLGNYTDQWQLLVFNVLGARFFASGIWIDGFGGNASRNVTTAQLKQRVWGDPPDAQNRSTAVVWYTAMDAHDAQDKYTPGNYSKGEAVIIKFHYYYPWNGCSNQLLALAIGGKFQGNEYYMCPPGVHEGDLEHMSLLVSVARYNESNPFDSIMRVQYAAHSWNSQYDCYLGECQWEVDDQGLKRLVAYSGLYSHAMYPKPSPLQLYMKVSASFLLNVDGVYIGDRTAKRVGYSNGTTFGGVVFQPTANNTRFLPFMGNMTAAQLQGEFAWAAYPGSFGGYIVSSGSTSIPCLFGNFSYEGPCPAGNPATSYIDYFLTVKDGGSPPVAIQNLTWTNNIKAPYTVNPILGPLYRTYTYVWENSNSPPLYDNPNVEISCPFTGSPEDTTISTNYSDPNVTVFLLSLAAILIGSAALFTLALFFPLMSAESETKYLLRLLHQAKHAAGYAGGNSSAPPGADGATAKAMVAPVQAAAGDGANGKGGAGGHAGDGVGPETLVKPKTAWWRFWDWGCWMKRPRDPWEPDTLNMGRHLGWTLLALGMTIGGIALTAYGIDGVVKATSEIYDLALWHQIRDALVAVLIVFGVLHVLVIIGLIFFRNAHYIRLTFVKVFNPLSRWRSASRLGWISNGVMSGLHVLAINTTVLLFSFGVFLTVAQIIVQVACNTALEQLFNNVQDAAYVCIDLNPFGLNVSFCAGDLTHVCSLWQGLSAPFIAYGTLMLVLAHLLMLSLCVQQFATMRNVLIAMDPKLRPLLDVEWEDEQHEQFEKERRASEMGHLEAGAA